MLACADVHGCRFSRTRLAVIPPMNPVRRCLMLLPLLCCAALAGCDLRAAAQAGIDVCAFAAPPVTDLIPAATVSPGRAQPPQAGTCQFQATAQDGRPLRAQVSLYTYASGRKAETRLENVYRINLAEAGANFGGAAGHELDDISADSAVLGLDAGGGGQLLIFRRGVILEISCAGLPREQAIALARQLWAAVQRLR
jgi:hypothetical protein